MSKGKAVTVTILGIDRQLVDPQRKVAKKIMKVMSRMESGTSESDIASKVRDIDHLGEEETDATYEMGDMLLMHGIDPPLAEDKITLGASFQAIRALPKWFEFLGLNDDDNKSGSNSVRVGADSKGTPAGKSEQLVS